MHGDLFVIAVYEQVNHYAPPATIPLLLISPLHPGRRRQSPILGNPDLRDHFLDPEARLRYS